MAAEHNSPGDPASAPHCFGRIGIYLAPRGPKT